MNLTPLKKLTKLAVIPAVLVSASAFANIQGGPIMRLFPTTVLEDIRETGQVAETMEDNLQELFNQLMILMMELEDKERI